MWSPSSTPYEKYTGTIMKMNGEIVKQEEFGTRKENPERFLLTLPYRKVSLFRPEACSPHCQPAQ